MEFGISSSCFYPENIEDGLKKVGELGAKTAELFINAPMEMKSPYLDELKAIREHYGIDIRSIHACTSAFETFFFFSTYDRRRYDGVEFYKRYFDAANEFGAKYIVFHGGLNRSAVSPECYAESYALLHDEARKHGVYMAHENVWDHLCGDPGYMKKVADIIGDEFKMILDIKQCRRCGVSEFDFIRIFGKQIAQVHISDCLGEKDCLAPGCGTYDFKKLVSALNEAGYDESAVIELYRQNYGEPEELKTALDFLNKNC